MMLSRIDAEQIIGLAGLVTFRTLRPSHVQNNPTRRLHKMSGRGLKWTFGVVVIAVPVHGTHGAWWSAKYILTMPSMVLSLCKGYLVGNDVRQLECC